MQVLKFGGSSVASAKNINLVSSIIKEKASEGPIIAVISALGGMTSQLIECSELAASGSDQYQSVFASIEKKHIQIIKELLPATLQGKTLSKVKILLNELEDIYRGIFLIQELSDRTSDKVVSFGEILSSTIIADHLAQANKKVALVDPREFIKTDVQFGRANVDFKKSNRLVRKHFKESEGISICPGFIASGPDDIATTLGRGGSDYTASILASALKTKKLEIWTDVSGMMTADPRLVRSAYAISEISYEEAMELSHFGAKVIYPPTIQPVLEKNIPIHIKNTFAKEDQGTLISNKAGKNGRIIKGLSSINNIALCNLSGSGMVGIPNFSYRLFSALSAAKINVIMITQASSEHSISVGIDANDALRSKEAMEQEFIHELDSHKIDPLEIQTGLSIIALVGSNMEKQVGVSGQMFSILGQNGINIKAIAQGSSEKNISVVIREEQARKALNSLHESFFLSEKKRINLFMIGVGNVGGAFVEQLNKQKSYLSKHHHLDIRVTALANSKKMLFDGDGISLKNWKDVLIADGEKMKAEAFIDKMVAMNARNSIFIDNTANEDIASLYNEILSRSISIVTPNKIACTQSYEDYSQLKSTSLRYKSKFFFETNVGAGLPIINTLNDLIKSGDEILKIEAVLSGSLNFIFNNFNTTTKFDKIVKQAQTEGYTEPDPRIDLSGVDVKRKILILIRESGLSMEMDEISTQQFIPEECMNAKSVDEFFKLLVKYEDSFQELLAQAAKKDAQIKYVASFNKGKAETGIRFIDKDHPFYNLEGKDNIVLFTTKRYPEQPLVIKGAGAGAEVTASGIFADVMRIANG